MKNLRIEKLKNLSLAALLMAGAAFTACSSSSDEIIEQPVNPTEPQVYTLVVKASKGGDTTTRALKTGSDGIDAYWIGGKDGEKIDVLQNGVKIGTATAAASDDENTTITATLTSAPDETDDLIFYLCGSNWDYTGQVGLLTGTGGNSISEKYDYVTGVLYGYSYEVNGSNVTPKESTTVIKFEDGITNQAIIKFTLQDKGNSNAAISPKALTITDGTSTVSLTDIPASTYTANGAGVLYVAFPAAGDGKTITLTARAGDGNGIYTYTTSSAKTFTNGKYYAITVKMNKILARVNGSTAEGVLGGGYTAITAEQAATLAKECWTVAGGTVYVVYSASGSLFLPNVSYVYTSDGETTTLGSANDAMQLYSLYGDGNTAWFVEPYTMATAATNEDKGKLICTDGHIHAKNADATCTKDRVAMIAYVGAASDCNHGLAIALENVTNKSLRWDNSGSNNNGMTAGQWCNAWNTNKKVEGGTWRLPSIVDWQYMLIGCGASGDVNNNPTSSFYMSYSGLASKLSTAGGDDLSNYWSSTEFNDNKAWYLSFSGGDNAYINTGDKTGTCNARACLAF